MQDYDTLSMEQLVDELQILVNNDKVMSVKDHVEEIKKAFLAQYNHFIEEKKRRIQAENPDTTEDFQYQFHCKV
jgi:soluble cytochrome b562